MSLSSSMAKVPGWDTSPSMYKYHELLAHSTHVQAPQTSKVDTVFYIMGDPHKEIVCLSAV